LQLCYHNLDLHLKQGLSHSSHRVKLPYLTQVAS
jgi:hypothetical protein